MSYYQKVLQPGETVKYVGKLHWIIYRHAIVFVVITVIVAIFSLMLPEEQRYLGLLGVAVFGFLTIIAFLRAWFMQWTTETVVTDKRIIHKLGFIARRTQEINITKVETVDVRQTFWGRILGYGSVAAIGTGASLETLQYVASPVELRNSIVVG